MVEGDTMESVSVTSKAHSRNQKQEKKKKSGLGEKLCPFPLGNLYNPPRNK